LRGGFDSLLAQLFFCFLLLMFELVISSFVAGLELSVSFLRHCFLGPGSLLIFLLHLRNM
ncbi:hypothetical protein QBC32DRAFT_341056, partial [Pseudoneurospora amorphoporcata]